MCVSSSYSLYYHRRLSKSSTKTKKTQVYKFAKFECIFPSPFATANMYSAVVHSTVLNCQLVTTKFAAYIRIPLYLQYRLYTKWSFQYVPASCHIGPLSPLPPVAPLVLSQEKLPPYKQNCPIALFCCKFCRRSPWQSRRRRGRGGRGGNQTAKLSNPDMIVRATSVGWSYY